MEGNHLWTIFHSYVKLPEGTHGGFYIDIAMLVY